MHRSLINKLLETQMCLYIQTRKEKSMKNPKRTHSKNGIRVQKEFCEKWKFQHGKRKPRVYRNADFFGCSNNLLCKKFGLIKKVTFSYYLAEKNRLFLMSPLHHHYQKMNYHESKIVNRMIIIGIMLAVFCLITLKLR